jgi:ABC-type branched-subunit amino acid transport system ATPase component
VSVVLVEQNIPAALSVASRIYVLRSGRIILEESSSSFAARGRETWWNLF